LRCRTGGHAGFAGVAVCLARATVSTRVVSAGSMFRQITFD
jgi:hypothetical protein